jgi:feruloyl-CoA synthase
MSVYTPIRDVRLPEPSIEIIRRGDGGMILRSRRKLPSYRLKATEALDHWASRDPDRLFVAQRGADGEWIRLSYGETQEKARVIAAALLSRGLSEDRPLLILSRNDLQHLLLNMACYYAGIPYAPVSPSYSLLSKDFSKLTHIVAELTPGLVYASDGGLFGTALDRVVPADVEIAVAKNPPPGRNTVLFSELLACPNERTVSAANALVGPDTIAKFLYTSGSTGIPKAVVNTQRMICSNQAMIRESLPFLAETPPVIVDWLPWSHTFGGNHNLGIALFNGGSYYIDEGRPTLACMGETIRTLREISPTIFFNVPRGYEELVIQLDADPTLRRRFFSRMQMLLFAGAGMAQYVYDELDRLSLAACGQRTLLMGGFGATESSPSALFCVKGVIQSGAIGLPVAGVDLKLVPAPDGRMEARLKGPNITPGYWRQPEETAASFDEDGYYRLGDTVRFADPTDPLKGLFFDGRVAEDFKLSSGTWVHVGPLRIQLIAALAPYARDVVITGHERDEIGVLIFPDIGACAKAADIPPASPEAVIANRDVRAIFRDRLAMAAAASTGTSNRVTRALLLHEAPTIDHGELTDKGSINQRAVLMRRAATVRALYAEPPMKGVILIPARNSR